ncbi:hypothetical protein D5086_009319 [Populus alba]|uniref:Uncharacterized protein n=1 Tax=Populus alba TaxID=43335 RepID=A0ACC4CJA4_POPAL
MAKSAFSRPMAATVMTLLVATLLLMSSEVANATLNYDGAAALALVAREKKDGANGRRILQSQDGFFGGIEMRGERQYLRLISKEYRSTVFKGLTDQFAARCKTGNAQKNAISIVWMEVVGEVFLSALLEPLLRKLTSGDLLNFVRKTQVEKELNKWRRRLSEIDAVLKDADEKQITSSTVKIWLTKLRDLAYDVEDVLDEFQTEALASKVRAESQASSSTVRKLLPTCCAGLNPSAIELNMRTGSRLRDITTRLEAIAKEKNELDVGIMAEQRPKGVKKREPCSVESYAAVRHSSFTSHRHDISQRFDVFNEMKNLRTFLALPPYLLPCHHLSSKPHRSLEELSVTSYGGTEFPSWIGDSCYSKLVHLKLLTCRKITSLSSVGKLPALSHLRIEGMDGVKEVYAEDFQSLETLYIDDMLGAAPDLTSLASLQLIQISGLVSLHDELVQALVALEDLDLEWCDELTYLWQDGVDLDKLSSLKRLRILGCEQLLSLVEGEEGILPCNLEVLSVQNCSNLEKLADGLSSLTSLRDLTIRCCRKLECFSEGAGLPLSLKRLQISHCGSLRSLPDGMMTVVNDSLLEKLVVTACPSLKWLPKGKLPKTLKDLNISWSLPEGILQRDARETSCSNLEHLTLQDLSATTFPTGEFPISLKELDIFNCRIPLLPPLHFLFHLTTLRICRCNELKSFPKGGLPPNLTFLEIRSCKITLPVSEWGLRMLTSLKRFAVESTIDVDRFPDDEEWGLRMLTSLKRFSVKFTIDVDRFPDDEVKGTYRHSIILGCNSVSDVHLCGQTVLYKPVERANERLHLKSVANFIMLFTAMSCTA